MAPKTAVDRSKSKGKKVANSSHEPGVLPTFFVIYPSTPLPQRGDLGADERGLEEADLLSDPSVSTFRRMITDAPLESINREPIVKPVLLFGDSSEDPDLLDIGTYEWLRTGEENDIDCRRQQRAKAGTLKGATLIELARGSEASGICRLQPKAEAGVRKVASECCRDDLNSSNGAQWNALHSKKSAPNHSCDPAEQNAQYSRL
ncbi:uncharacterized protein A4U43_C10F11390 [Asparagus officinalis]|uniref:Uncharacterized protein n=1 Tax=Asparagus officinalis TaxID=4686 RepID=A0A5P1E6N3_ASPOF|nr:uncharacterized protein A4U43_C10F11390 [Asparagus officinalis]